MNKNTTSIGAESSLTLVEIHTHIVVYFGQLVGAAHTQKLVETCMMTEIQDLEGVQKRCPPKKDQHKKK